MVKVINIDPSGKIRLSRKALLDRPRVAFHRLVRAGPARAASGLRAVRVDATAAGAAASAATGIVAATVTVVPAAATTGVLRGAMNGALKPITLVHRQPRSARPAGATSPRATRNRAPDPGVANQLAAGHVLISSTRPVRISRGGVSTTAASGG